jgi:hypothetical protein
MLHPTQRSLYTAALTPPPGYVFDEAIGTTFSLDPSVLLTVPVHLALLGGRRVQDAFSVLAAIRRLADRITVYAQRGRLQVPGEASPLYGLLEAMTVEVSAPRGGVFHPKLWLLRFRDPEDEEAVMLRLLVLSRNLTLDRSWDVALTLEGTPGRRNHAANKALGELFAALPSWAAGPAVDAARVAQAERLAGELRRTKWAPPPGYDSVELHVFGHRAQKWSVPSAKRAAIISPFCAEAAIRHICDAVTQVDALITRPEALLELSPGTRARCKRLVTLAEAAETEDGEDVAEVARDTLGLHAKVYLFERGSNTHLFVGSANATNAALLVGTNVEVLVELVGKSSRVGGVEKLLGAEGLGDVLVEAILPGPPSTDVVEAEKALEKARDELSKRDLRMVCTPEDGETWRLNLVGLGQPLAGISHARAWPITLRPEGHTVDLWPQGGGPVGFSKLATASVTGLVAMELGQADLRCRFVLNLPVEGLPEGRDAAILQWVVRDRPGFLRYLLMLLGDLGPVGDVGEEAGGGAPIARWVGQAEGSLLEEMVRAYSHEPERLHEVGRAIEALSKGDAGAADSVVSPDFIALWRVFQQALTEAR